MCDLLKSETISHLLWPHSSKAIFQYFQYFDSLIFIKTGDLSNPSTISHLLQPYSSKAIFNIGNLK